MIFALIFPTVFAKDDLPPSLLFVQSAGGMSFDAATSTLTLQDVSLSVIFFSDRPNRIAGHVEIAGFIKTWGEGAGSFAADPPNSNLSVVDDNGINNVIVEITDPKFDGDNLIYDVMAVAGDLPLRLCAEQKRRGTRVREVDPDFRRGVCALIGQPPNSVRRS